MLPKRSYLIQRLRIPFKSEKETLLTKLSNPFAFGGGLINGGLSKEATELLKDIFEFDYMGAAEYEWGEVPRALSKIFENSKDYIAFEIDVKYKYKDFDYKKQKRNQLKGLGKVYVICHKDWQEDVTNLIKARVLDEYNDKFRARDWIGLDKSLAINKRESFDIAGWLELSNGYFFFTDKEMFEKTCELFQLKKETK